ncbi:hypothetical protein B0H11DRAFT_1913040 [Mycena galericulata]|nr:hypothetical protein B0H11DRAFT_1913040 [Mycena galericulata]
MDKMKTALTSTDSEFRTTKPERPGSPISNNSVPPQSTSVQNDPLSSVVHQIPVVPGALYSFIDRILPDFLYAEQPVVENQAVVDEVGELQPQSHARDSGANHPSLESPTQDRPLLLLIEDTRGPINVKISQRIQVSAMDQETSATGEWKANSREIADALQSSISAFEGLARIGVADPDNPGYTIFLAIITGSETLQNEVQTSSVPLAIQGNGKLTLTVTNIGVFVSILHFLPV